MAGKGPDPVHHPALQEFEIESACIRIEEPVVERLGIPGVGVADQQRVVSEQLPDCVAGLHGEQMHRQRGTGDRSLGRRRFRRILGDFERVLGGLGRVLQACRRQIGGAHRKESRDCGRNPITTHRSAYYSLHFFHPGRLPPHLVGRGAGIRGKIIKALKGVKRRQADFCGGWAVTGVGVAYPPRAGCTIFLEPLAWLRQTGRGAAR